MKKGSQPHVCRKWLMPCIHAYMQYTNIACHILTWYKEYTIMLLRYWDPSR